MTYSVKRIRGRLYVYETRRVNGRSVTRYVAPLEALVEAFRVVKLLESVNYKLTPRRIRILESRIADRVVNKLGFWCGGRDLNPGPPAWQAGVLVQARRPPPPFIGIGVRRV